MIDYDFDFHQCCYRFLANFISFSFFLLFRMSSAPFLWASLTIVFVVLLSLWQAMIMRLLIDIPIFSNIFITVFSKFVIVIIWGMSSISIHSRLEYCSSLHWRRSVLISCSFNFFIFDFRRLDVLSATASQWYYFHSEDLKTFLINLQVFHLQYRFVAAVRSDFPIFHLAVVKTFAQFAHYPFFLVDFLS